MGAENNYKKTQDLIHETKQMFNLVQTTITDILHLFSYKCMITKNNKELNEFIGDNDNDIYLNSRKIWYENYELIDLKKYAFYYFIIYLVFAIGIVVKAFYYSNKSKFWILAFVILWPMLGYYFILSIVSFYTFISMRIFNKNVYVNLANKTS